MYVYFLNSKYMFLFFSTYYFVHDKKNVLRLIVLMVNECHLLFT